MRDMGLSVSPLGKLSNEVRPMRCILKMQWPHPPLRGTFPRGEGKEDLIEKKSFW